MVYIGDIHGNIPLIYQFIQKHEIMNENFIQVGDFGLGFNKLEKEQQLMFDLNEHLVANNNMLYVIRGNHDDPKYWTTNIYDFSNIKLVPDYTVLTIEEKKILFVGGAISIDRVIRATGSEWWPDEVFVYDEEKLKELDLAGLNYVVTHSAPRFVHPRVFGSVVYTYTAIDPKLEDDLNAERDKISQLYDYLDKIDLAPQKYFYGHFHASHREQIEDTEFVLVGIDQFLEIRS